MNVKREREKRVGPTVVGPLMCVCVCVRACVWYELRCVCISAVAVPRCTPSHPPPDPDQGHFFLTHPHTFLHPSPLRQTEFLFSFFFSFFIFFCSCQHKLNGISEEQEDHLGFDISRIQQSKSWKFWIKILNKSEIIKMTEPEERLPKVEEVRLIVIGFKDCQITFIMLLFVIEK